jgi:hypothetical protein
MIEVDLKMEEPIEVKCARSVKMNFDSEKLNFFCYFYFSKFNLGCRVLAHKITGTITQKKINSLGLLFFNLKF